MRVKPAKILVDNLYHLSLISKTIRFLLVSTVLVLLITSCSTKRSRPDGPPNFFVDESQIQNAIPRPEAMAKYGNMNSYWVFGKKYYVLKSYQGYEATGTASWYGTKFHARRTSSGEPYNMLAMTAAHKTLPLPTYVEVINLANNRKIIVKVNDRGPFEGNRLIDLSYVAAKKLGMLGRGTAHVKIKAINPYTYGRPIFTAQNRFQSRPKTFARPTITAASTKPKTFAYPYPKIIKTAEIKQLITQTNTRTLINSKGKFTHVNETRFVRPKIVKQVYLQVGAFRNRSNAIRLQQKIESLLASPVIVTSPTDKVKLYRVQVGPLDDVPTADKLALRLKGFGIKPNMTFGA